MGADALTALVVEDHPLYRHGLAQLVESLAGLPAARAPAQALCTSAATTAARADWRSGRATGAAVRCEAVASAAEATARFERGRRIDWLISDLKLPDRDGWQFVAEVRRRWPDVCCVVVSGSEERTVGERAAALGCRGFLPKAMEPAAMGRALAALFAGERQFGQAAPTAPTLQLTARQEAVLRGLAAGRTSRAIAEDLGIAERTVKDHLAVLYGRLDAGTRAEAVARAAALGLLRPPQG